VSDDVQTKIQQIICGIEGATKLTSEADEDEAVRLAQLSNHTEDLRRLVEREPQVLNAQLPLQESTTTLLYTAARSNALTTVKMLLQLGANPDEQVFSGSTALHVACYRGNVEIVEAIMQHRPRPRTDIINKYNEACNSLFADELSFQVRQQINKLITDVDHDAFIRPHAQTARITSTSTSRVIPTNPLFYLMGCKRLFCT